MDGLKGCMTEALRQFFDRNQFLPDKIIVYRDGVGDGQYVIVFVELIFRLDAVVEHEIPQLVEAFDTNFPNYKPKLGFIIVKKRINTRLFSKGLFFHSSSYLLKLATFLKILLLAQL